MTNFNIPQNNYPFQDNTAMYQQRLNNMANQFLGNGNGQQSFMPQMMNGMTMQQPQTAQAQQQFNMRAVTGYEEAMASQIPLDGSISIFTDFSHNRIYTKQLNMNDGTALMKTYQITENPQPNTMSADTAEQYVKKSDFDELKGRFDKIWEELTAPAEEKKEG